MPRRDRIRIYSGLTHDRLLEIWREDRAAELLERARVHFMDTPTMNQQSMRWRNDDGDEASATWKAAADTDITLTVSGDTRIRCRALIQETAGNANNNYGSAFQYSHNSGAWTVITDSTSVIKSNTASQLVDGDDTTQQLGAGTFVTPNAGQADASTFGGSGACDFAGNDETEFEFGGDVIDADVSNNDTIDVRISDNNIDVYTIASIRITVDKGAAPAGPPVGTLAQMGVGR